MATHTAQRIVENHLLFCHRPEPKQFKFGDNKAPYVHLADSNSAVVVLDKPVELWLTERIFGHLDLLYDGRFECVFNADGKNYFRDADPRLLGNLDETQRYLCLKEHKPKLLSPAERIIFEKRKKINEISNTRGIPILNAELCYVFPEKESIAYILFGNGRLAGENPEYENRNSKRYAVPISKRNLSGILKLENGRLCNAEISPKLF